MRLTQNMIYRAVAGAVRNARHGHRDWPLNDTHARSIAKRATGTLLAQFREHVGGDLPSEAAESLDIKSRRAARSLASSCRRGGGVAPVIRRLPYSHRLKVLRNTLGAMVKEAKLAEQPIRVEALIDALRLVAKFDSEK